MAFECLIKSKITAEEWAELLNDGWETRHVVIHEPMEAAHLIAAAYIRASPVLVSVAMTRTTEDRKAVIDTVAADAPTIEARFFESITADEYAKLYNLGWRHLLISRGTPKFAKRSYSGMVSGENAETITALMIMPAEE